MHGITKTAAALTSAACVVALWPGQAGAETKTPAQAGSIRILAKGLEGPRQLAAAHGRFYVAESDAGRITAINPRTGAKRVVVKGLSNPQGVTRVGDKLYIATGVEESGPPSNAAVRVVNRRGKVSKFADLLAYELKHNPDGQTQFGKDGKPLDTLSNPYYVIRDRSRHGFLLVADAGANDVLRIDRHGKISTLFVPPTVKTGACAKQKNNNASGKGCDSVPTGLAYGPHGRLYVSALTSEVPGEGRVYVINPHSGRLIRVIKGFTAPTGVAVTRRGTVYVSELLEGAPQGAPPAGFDPSTVGQIVRVSCHHHRTYAQVTMPSGLLLRHGRLYSSAWAVASFVGLKKAGQVVRVQPSAFVRAR